MDEGCRKKEGGRDREGRRQKAGAASCPKVLLPSLNAHEPPLPQPKPAPGQSQHKLEHDRKLET
jgi:hypothetical protein